VGFPTETVYGLGARADDPDAVRRIFAAKGRPADNPLIVHLADVDELPRVVATITPLARELARRFLPGPLTLVLDARADLPGVTTGGLTTVAVRVPAHPVAAALLATGRPPRRGTVGQPLGAAVPDHRRARPGRPRRPLDVVLDGGPCPVGVESTVVDARGRDRWSCARARSPASTSRRTATRPIPRAARLAGHALPALRAGLRGAARAAGHGPAVAAARRDGGQARGAGRPVPAPDGVVEVARFADAAGLARQLYAALRDAELAHLDVLVVESVPEDGIGRAVMDRLRRAAQAG
jgi:L-threonylcarbamoyladenylate synthase